MTAVRLFTTSLLVVLSVSALAAEKRTDLPTISGETGVRLYSTGTHQALAARETAGPDTFALYGGPDAGLEGKFQTSTGPPDFQGWTPVDLTDIQLAWQVSTFMADNLNGNGPGNHAYWCGQDETQQPELGDRARLREQLGPGTGLGVAAARRPPGVADRRSLDFFFNTDLED